jgi:hypothetical protein
MKTAVENTGETAGAYQINVLLAYDSAPTCGAILSMFERISARLCDQKLFNVNAFKFGLLERMDLFKWASAGAGAADLVMVACGGEGAPGASLLRWLEDWAEHHAGRDSALGFLPMGALAGEPVRRLVRSLRTIAARHGLRFIYGAEAGALMLQEAGTAMA